MGEVPITIKRVRVMATIALWVELITPNIEEAPLTLRQVIKLRAPVPEGSGRDS
jgi:hypothetical protein